MKKQFVFLIVLLLCVTILKAQNCITVVSSQFQNPSGDSTHWRLVINYVANGTKNLRTYVFNGGDTLVNACFQTSNQTQTGTITYDNIVTTWGSSLLSAKFIRRTGTCDNGAVCGAEQNLSGGVLDIKITNLYARNIKNTTEITFKVLSIDETARVSLNFYMPSGKIEKREVVLPQARPGDIWKVTFDNITKKYSTQKIN